MSALNTEINKDIEVYLLKASCFNDVPMIDGILVKHHFKYKLKQSIYIPFNIEGKRVIFYLMD